jgi:rRNA processing protein Gar1
VKNLGPITSITKKGDLLVQVTKPYPFGAKIVNKQLESIGKIVDVIGPVKTPYLVINTRNAEAQAKVGETVYLSSVKRKRSQHSSAKRRKSQRKR